MSPQTARRIAVLVLIALIGAAAAFIVADRQVAATLASRRQHRVPAVVSDMIRIESMSSISPARLRRELVARSYVEVADRPVAEGQYRFWNGGFEIVPRALRLPSGQFQKAVFLRIDANQDDQRGFFLEPRVVAYLGANDIQARSFRRLDDIPSHVVQAVLAIEDERFEQHIGIDVIGIIRAMIVNLRRGGLVQGGSTITQQLAKNLFLSPARTLRRKVREVFAALSLELRLSKSEILELYLNEIYLGQEGQIALHGVPEAARAFFAKEIKRLSLGEAALLAGIIRAPSLYNPRRHPQRAKRRRNVVLSKMLELGMIPRAAAERAIAEPLVVLPETYHRRVAPHFVDSLAKLLGRSVNVSAATLSGLTVYTGLDLDLQRCAEQAVSDEVGDIERAHPGLRRRQKPLEGALVALEPYSGKVRAWAGGRDYARNQFDHVAQAMRQIGSTFKPFVYLTALDDSLNSYRQATPVTVLPDRPIAITLASGEVWEPKNFDERFRGDVTLRYALEHSLNMPALHVAKRVGFDALADTAELFRLSETRRVFPALALGATDTTLLRLTAAYGALANGGVYVEPRLFISAVDPAGSEVAREPLTESRVADEASVAVLTNILQGVIERGTARSVRSRGYSGVAAGKTGTSDQARDAWFIGYTPSLAVGAWVGFDDNTPIGLTGGQAAVPLWTSFMRCAANIVPSLDFIVPRGVKLIDIDLSTGQVASSRCPSEQVVREIFVAGTEPSRRCQTHTIFGEEDGDRYTSRQQATSGSTRRPARRLWGMIFGDE